MRLLPWMSRWCLMTASVLAPGSATAADKHYLVVFAAQAKGEPQFVHTFATFIRIVDTVPRREEICTISWLPRSMEVVLSRWQPEPGKNFDLRTTLEWAKSRDALVTYCGPYEVKKELFDKARAHEKKLAAGKTAYTARLAGFRPQEAVDCIHAVAEIDGSLGMLEASESLGKASVHVVARHFEKWMLERGRPHAEIMSRLSADDFKLYPADEPVQTLSSPTRSASAYVFAFASGW